MTAAIVGALLLAMISIAVLLLVCTRFMRHVELERQSTADLAKSVVAILATLQDRPAQGFEAFAATVERIMEKSLGDIQTVRQHTMERAAASENRTREREAAHRNGTPPQPMTSFMPSALDDETVQMEGAHAMISGGG